MQFTAYSYPVLFDNGDTVVKNLPAMPETPETWV